jgi:putative acetyltransferase
MRPPPLLMVVATTPLQYAHGLQLIGAYLRQLGEDVSFQNPDWELQHLAQQYGPPSGLLLLAYQAEQAVGCVAYKTIGPGIAEMKRLFVLPTHQGQKIGAALAEAIVVAAKAAGCHTMVLDTVERLQAARALYQKMGFAPCAPYYHNPLPGAVYLSKTL